MIGKKTEQTRNNSMAIKKKRKTSLVNRYVSAIKQSELESTKRPAMKSKNTRKIISQFHTLLKQQQRSTDPKEKQLINQEIEKLGGLSFYQHCSLIGQSKERGGDSSDFLIAYMKDHNLCESRLRLLDIGALKNNYIQYGKWIDPTCIDLNSQSTDIIQCDFMEYTPDPVSMYDVVCQSLVLNFCPSPEGRGDMLKRVLMFLKPSGLFFIVLPISCVTNSRYLTHEHFVDGIMKELGFECLKHQFTTKLAYYIFKLERVLSLSNVEQLEFKKKKLNDGKFRNNFGVVLVSKLVE